MRRLIALLIVSLLLLPAAAFAQDSEMLWELDKESYLDVTDLGFRFYYPTGWVWASGDGGIVIAPTQADLDAQMDGDDSTLPEDKVITLVGFPISDIAGKNKNPTLDDLADIVVETGGISESTRFEVPVMSRRSIWVAGENSLGRSGIAALWTQNGYLILASLGAPDEQTISDTVYTWGYTLGNVTPLDAQDLGADQLSSDLNQFTMQVPDGWTLDPDEAQSTTVVYELTDDVNAQLEDVDGLFLSLIDGKLTDLSFPEDTTAQDLAAAMNASFGLDKDKNATQEEFVFLDQPAVVSTGAVDDGSGGTRGVILTAAVVGENAVVFVLIAPTPEDAVAFAPTWTSMMQSVISTAA